MWRKLELFGGNDGITWKMEGAAAVKAINLYLEKRGPNKQSLTMSLSSLFLFFFSF